MASTAPGEKPRDDDVFAVLRDRVRAAVFERRVDLAALLRPFEVEAGGGWIGFGDLRRTLHTSLRISLSAAETELLKKHFVRRRDCSGGTEGGGKWSPVVNCHRLLRALQLVPPGVLDPDYMDPEQLRDQLPQPFRMIVKVLEEDVLDRAWDEIERRRKAAAAGAGWPAGQEAVAHMRAKGTLPEHVAFPTAAREGFGLLTAIGTSFEGDRLILGNATGELFAADSAGHVLASCAVGAAAAAQATAPPAEPGQEEDLAQGQAAAQSGPVCCVSNLVNRQRPSDNRGASDGAPTIFAACAAAAPSGTGAGDTDEGAAEDEGEGQAQADACDACDVLVFELWASPADENPRVTPAARVRLRAPATRLRLSEDGVYLAAADAEGTVSVFALAPPSAPPPVAAGEVDGDASAPGAGDAPAAAARAGGVALVLEEEDEERARALLAAQASRSSAAGAPAAPEPKGKGKAAKGKGKKAEPAADEVVATPAAALPPPPPPDLHFVVMGGAAPRSASATAATSAVVVCRMGRHAFRRYNLGAARGAVPVGKPSAAAAKSDAADKDKGKGKGKGKSAAPAAAAEEDDAARPTARPTAVGEWAFSAPISCTAIDSTGQLLAVGLEDGNVVVHDTQFGVHVCHLPRHRSAVRCVAVHRQQYVLSGGDDELLHLCDIGPWPGASDAAEMAAAAAKTGVVAGSHGKPRLVALRDDGRSAVVAAACFSDVPIGVVCSADNCVRLYDLQRGDKVGDLATSRDGSWVPAVGSVVPGDKAARAQLAASGEHVYLLAQRDSGAEAAGVAKAQARHAMSGGRRDAGAGAVDIAAEELRSRLLAFAAGETVKALCPAIANACAGTDGRWRAKHLFATTPHTQRVDAGASLGFAGGMPSRVGMGGFEAGGASQHDRVRSALVGGTSVAGSRVSCQPSRQRSRGGRASSKGERAGAAGRTTQFAAQQSTGGAGGLSAAMLEEPGRVRLPRAPAYIDAAQRAKRNMMRAGESRAERQARLSQRRQQMISNLTPQV
eukprot:g1259.t1